MFYNLMQSDRIYNAGWTMDIRDINNHLREEYPDAPLYLVGLSIGANIVVRLSVLFSYLCGYSDCRPDSKSWLCMN